MTKLTGSCSREELNRSEIVSAKMCIPYIPPWDVSFQNKDRQTQNMCKSPHASKKAVLVNTQPAKNSLYERLTISSGRATHSTIYI